jgi:hypothetical protein
MADGVIGALVVVLAALGVLLYAHPSSPWLGSHHTAARGSA